MLYYETEYGYTDKVEPHTLTEHILLGILVFVIYTAGLDTYMWGAQHNIHYEYNTEHKTTTQLRLSWEQTRRCCY